MAPASASVPVSAHNAALTASFFFYRTTNHYSSFQHTTSHQSQDDQHQLSILAHANEAISDWLICFFFCRCLDDMFFFE
jgi:hypothetical protein